MRMTTTNSSPAGERPPATEPLHFILDALEDLRMALQHSESDPKRSSYLEMIDKFNRISDKKRGCSYALKAQKLFLLSDYDKIKNKILTVLKQIRALEKDFGKE